MDADTGAAHGSVLLTKPAPLPTATGYDGTRSTLADSNDARMPRTSAGLLMYRRTSGGIEVFLVHPGGPFWAKKDAGAWSIPKGEYLPGEDPLDAARREFVEETGIVPDGELVELGTVKQAGGKIVTAWAFEGDCDPDAIRSNTFAMEWPPRSGRQQEFPEVDRAAWFDLERAAEKILKGQLDFIRRLGEMLRT